MEKWLDVVGMPGFPAYVRSSDSWAVACSISRDSQQAVSGLRSEPRWHQRCREAWVPFLPLSHAHRPPAAFWSLAPVLGVVGSGEGTKQADLVPGE